jgi:hypothetical protein
LAFVYGHFWAQQNEFLASGPWLRGIRPLESPEVLSILVRPQFQEEYEAPRSFTLGRFTGTRVLFADPATFSVTAFDAGLVTSSTATFTYTLVAEPVSFVITIPNVRLQTPSNWIDIDKQTQTWVAQSADTTLWVDIPKTTTSWH